MSINNSAYNMSLIKPEDIENSVSYFKEITRKDPNCREQSFVHMRKSFLEFRKKKRQRDLLALNLFAYLASWGMLRNSFLLQKDYKYFIGLIDILSNRKYDILIKFDYFNIANNEEYVNLVLELSDDISNFIKQGQYYDDKQNILKNNPSPTTTLITKIMLGTFGCVVAYDTNVKKGLKSKSLSQSFCKKSLNQLLQLLSDNREVIERCVSCFPDKFHTPMRILDMYFYYEGISEGNQQ